MTQLVEVIIDSVRVSLTNQQRIVLLREKVGERFLPIWIGPYEAEAITISLQEIEVARPQTHDLVLGALEALSARLLRVEVVELKGDVFYGNLVVELNGVVHDVDARPSDSIALAVRAHVPILVNPDILDSAGILPETDIQYEILNGTREPESEHTEETETSDAQERLSLFEDFLKQVNLDDLPENDEDQDEPPNPDSDSSSQ